MVGYDGAMRKQYERLRRRPFLMPVWLTVVAVALVATAALWTLLAASTTLVIVVPAAGTARLDALVRLLDAGQGTPRIEALVAADDPTVRAAATALAARLGLTARMAVGDRPASLARAALAAHRGGRVVVVAASRDGGSVVTALSGLEAGELRDGEVLLVAVPRFSRPTLMRLSVP